MAGSRLARRGSKTKRARRTEPWTFIDGVGYVDRNPQRELASATSSEFAAVVRAFEERMRADSSLHVRVAQSVRAVSLQHLGAGANRRMSNTSTGGGGGPEGGGGKPGHIGGGPTDTRGVTAEAFWWGFHLVIPHAAMSDFTRTLDLIDDILEAVAGECGPAEPFIELAAQALKLLIGASKTVEGQDGIYFSMLWLAPGIFIPTARN